MNDAPTEVSVILPCLNEETTLGLCIDAAHRVLAEAGLTGEVIVADNASEDRSGAIAVEKGARVVEVVQRGYGNALRAGLTQARGQYLVFLDADMSYDFADIPRFVAALRAGADLVIGSRLKGSIEPNAMPFLHRTLGTPVMTAMANLLFRCGISDINCGMRGLTRDAFQRLDLHSEGMEFASEMMIKAAKSRLKITEIPITFHADQRETQPHLRSFRDGWRHMQLMLHYCPLWLFLVPGWGLVLAGLYVMLGGAQGLRGTLLDLAALVSVTFGIQILLLGFIAQGRVRASKYRGKTRVARIMNAIVRIETGMFLGMASVLAGVVLFIVAVRHASAAGTDAAALIVGVRQGLLGATFMINGLQVFFVSLFMGLFGIQVADDFPGLRRN